MATQYVPQYAEFSLQFTNLVSALTGQPIQLGNVDDIVLSIASGSPANAPILTLRKSTSPSRFTLDLTNSNVTVTILPADIGNAVGKFYVNLWIESGGNYTTHLPDSFTVKPAVNHN